ncbi:hypothetical protein [Bacillus sp. T33-2]|uniref:hypothetical protein n=1 Tax=Bacillus sp. T33-2 TaxID=2054168 RepID=UPI000C78484C|nr:hypothetical protein [Bacillus sp. T33-2]PLR92019.1 hypothetical protein CVD19_20940 [Bacillus sp. T33-2]
MLWLKNNVWVNIDKPTKKFTIHHKCAYTEKMAETPFKGINEMKRDGGWFSEKNEDRAIQLHNKCYPNYTMIRHC